jgi:protein-tyrosine phosphatase
MIDLHCHILPGIDDGAKDLVSALEMARIAVQDGIRYTACTPHIYPGVYENDSGGIRGARQALQARLEQEGIDLQLAYGADTHLVPEMLSGIREGRIPTLNGGRYFLLEPPHHVAPPQFKTLVFNTIAAGYTPLITHPERLTWADEHYEDFVELAHQGAWIQVTAGALTARFGRAARYLGEQMLDDGIVHVIATDAHDTRNRPPLLGEGREAAIEWVGREEAERMVQERPLAVLENRDPGSVTPVAALHEGAGRTRKKGLLGKLWPF